MVQNFRSLEYFKSHRKSKNFDNKGAIELSISTIVIVVLAMSMLILGLVLVKSIFKGATSISDMTNEQVKDQVSKLFSEDKKLVIYPDSRRIDIKMGTSSDGFGIVIKNLVQGQAGQGTKFSYEVAVADPQLKTKCGIGEKEALAYMITGQSDSSIPIPSGETTATKVLFSVPLGSSQCTIRYRVNICVNSASCPANSQNIYASDIIDVTIIPK